MTDASPLQKTFERCPEVQIAWDEFIISLQRCRRVQCEEQSDTSSATTEVNTAIIEDTVPADERMSLLEKLVDRIEAMVQAQTEQKSTAQQKYLEEKWRPEIESQINKLHKHYSEFIFRSTAIEREIAEMRKQMSGVIAHQNSKWWHRLGIQGTSFDATGSTFSRLSPAR